MQLEDYSFQASIFKSYTVVDRQNSDIICVLRTVWIIPPSVVEAPNEEMSPYVRELFSWKIGTIQMLICM